LIINAGDWWEVRLGVGGTLTAESSAVPVFVLSSTGFVKVDGAETVVEVVMGERLTITLTGMVVGGAAVLHCLIDGVEVGLPFFHFGQDGQHEWTYINEIFCTDALNSGQHTVSVVARGAAFLHNFVLRVQQFRGGLAPCQEGELINV
jgi:hypothetical protein